MIFNRRRVTQLERRCEFLEDDLRKAKGEIHELQLLMGQLLSDGIELQTEVQFVPADHLLEQKH